MLGLLGEWPEALVEARHACDRLAAPVNPAALGAACAIEGDLCRLVGDFPGAEDAYRRASEYGEESQPGLALLRLAQGRLDVADAMIRRVLAERGDPMSRARVLGAYVDIVLPDDPPAGRAAADELRAVAAEVGTPLLRAHAARADGSVLHAEGDHVAALVALRGAFNAYNNLGVRYEAARTRLLLADACAALGDHDTARIESSAAHAALEALGAQSDPSPTIGSLASDLSDRELEVLVLLSRGMTNRAIADELFISEKTVASHVSHIFTKIGVTSRSAATAYAYNHHLVG
jgi:DNA-binding NarL/FixJ family response regulator